jgi:hypothetical protein
MSKKCPLALQQKLKVPYASPGDGLLSEGLRFTVREENGCLERHEGVELTRPTLAKCQIGRLFSELEALA